MPEDDRKEDSRFCLFCDIFCRNISHIRASERVRPGRTHGFAPYGRTHTRLTGRGIVAVRNHVGAHAGGLMSEQGVVMGSFFLLTTAAFFAGVMNAVAGGGSFLTFPALVFTGVPSIIANASSTVALFPGSFASAWAYREDFTHFEDIPFKASLAVSLAGGASGAILLLSTSQHAFDVVIPWLLAFATILFAFGSRIAPVLKRRFHFGVRTVLVSQYLVAIYGGYFGGAVGIIMLSLFSLLGLRDIRSMNALKTLLGGSMNAVAVVCFVIAGKVWWVQTAVMLLGSVAGGYLGARYGRKVPQSIMRAVVVAIGVAMTVVFFTRA